MNRTFLPAGEGLDPSPAGVFLENISEFLEKDLQFLPEHGIMATTWLLYFNFKSFFSRPGAEPKKMTQYTIPPRVMVYYFGKTN